MLVQLLFSSNATSEVNEAHKKVVCQSATWHIGNADAEICYDTTLSAYFSKKCFESVCDAKTIKTEAGSLKISIEEKNPNHNPGSIVCVKLKGEVVIGRNPRGSEIVFCKATDGSLVDLSSLGK